MNEEQFKARTKQLALRVIRLARALPRDRIALAITNQLIRAGTSPGANYRAACRARSTADIIAKLKLVEEELDETAYWLELLVEDGIMPSQRILPLLKETNELLAMTVASIKTLRKRVDQPKVRSIVNRKS
jgi:four helix bundle protein